MLARLMGFVLLGLVRVLTGSQARWYGCPPKAGAFAMALVFRLVDRPAWPS
jgi:hypothetical protein